jgi:hypothetical protein
MLYITEQEKKEARKWPKGSPWLCSAASKIPKIRSVFPVSEFQQQIIEVLL